MPSARKRQRGLPWIRVEETGAYVGRQRTNPIFFYVPPRDSEQGEILISRSPAMHLPFFSPHPLGFSLFSPFLSPSLSFCIPPFTSHKTLRLCRLPRRSNLTTSLQSQSLSKENLVPQCSRLKRLPNPFLSFCTSLLSFPNDEVDTSTLAHRARSTRFLRTVGIEEAVWCPGCHDYHSTRPRSQLHRRAQPHWIWRLRWCG